MSQYSYELTPWWTADSPPYESWTIAEPTTRRLSTAVAQYRDPERPEGVPGTVVAPADAKRLTLTANSHGNSFIEIVTSSEAEFYAIHDSPGQRKRGEEWTANRPRYGTWAWYLAEVALLRYIFEFAGWTATPEEAALMDALEAYGKRAPARLAIA